MKKLLVLILLLLATPAMADLTCKETEGCTSSNPAKDCEALGYDAKTSLDKDCEHSLQCPFSKDYAKCVKWEELDPNEVCPALGYKNKEDITCSNYEECPYDKSKYAMCKDTNADCKSYGFVEGKLYKPNENSDEGSYGFIPFCLEDVECTDSTGTYYLCKKGGALEFCELESDCGYKVYHMEYDSSQENTVVKEKTGRLSSSTVRNFREKAKSQTLTKTPYCDGCKPCIFIPSDILLAETEKESLKSGNWKLLSQLQDTYKKDFLDFSCEHCRYTTKDSIISAHNSCSGGGSGDSSSSPLCNCDLGSWLFPDGHCSDDEGSTAVGIVYKIGRNMYDILGGTPSESQTGCYVLAVAIEEQKGEDPKITICDNDTSDIGYDIIYRERSNGGRDVSKQCPFISMNGSQQGRCFIPSTVDEKEFNDGASSYYNYYRSTAKFNPETCRVDNEGSNYYPRFIVRSEGSAWGEKYDMTFIVK